jgi:AcrR family transcriptional regulator
MFKMSQPHSPSIAPGKEHNRPTQEQRTGAMRARLLEATLDLIAEEGWAQTSTLKICHRAGVSRGAQTHHFPTKDSLLIAAVREIVIRYQAELDNAAGPPAESGTEFRGAIRLSMGRLLRRESLELLDGGYGRRSNRRGTATCRA